MRVETRVPEMLNAQKTIRLNDKMLKMINESAEKLNITSNEWLRIAAWEKLKKEEQA